LINADWIPSQIVSSPIITERSVDRVFGENPTPWADNLLTWSFDQSRHLIRCAYYVHRDPIFRDLFTKLEGWANGEIKIAV
jgi:purine nucleosidase